MVILLYVYLLLPFLVSSYTDFLVHGTRRSITTQIHVQGLTGVEQKVPPTLGLAYLDTVFTDVLCRFNFYSSFLLSCFLLHAPFLCPCMLCVFLSSIFASIIIKIYSSLLWIRRYFRTSTCLCPTTYLIQSLVLLFPLVIL